MINLQVWQPYGLTITDANGAQTDAAISPAIGPDERFEVMDLVVRADGDNAAAVAVRVGFAAATLPAVGTAGVRGMIFESAGLAPGTPNAIGIPGIGLKGEELRLTCEDPGGGSISINFLGRVVLGG